MSETKSGASKNPHLSSHRARSLSTRRILLTEETHEAISRIADEHGLNHDLAVRQLIEFFYLRKIDLLVRNLKLMHDRGLTSLEINQLSVLFTLLQHIDDRVGLK